MTGGNSLERISRGGTKSSFTYTAEYDHQKGSRLSMNNHQNRIIKSRGLTQMERAQFSVLSSPGFGPDA
jgi:hypothetical protein